MLLGVTMSQHTDVPSQVISPQEAPWGAADAPARRLKNMSGVDKTRVNLWKMRVRSDLMGIDGD
jgi:hypothetical protein